MGTARADNYSLSSGSAGHFGRLAPAIYPAWRQSMAPRTWKKVPFVNTFTSVDPALRADLNPSYPGTAPWSGTGGQRMVLDAWCSIWPSTSDGRIYAGPGGGHGDYAGNELYFANLSLDAPAWTLLKPPSGALPGSAVTYGDGGDSNGGAGVYLADGRVRGNHNYNNIIHIPGTTKLFMSAVAAMYSSGYGGPAKSWYFDTETGDQSNAFDYSGLAWGSGSGEGSGVCYDSLRNCIWHMRNGSGVGARMIRMNLADGTMSLAGSQDTWIQGYGKMHYVPGLDLVVLFDGTTIGFKLFRPSTGDWSRYPANTGSRPASLASVSGSGSGWVPSLGKFLLWGNPSNPAEFTTLTPPASGDPFTGTWTWGSMQPDASNTVTPPAATSSGASTDAILGRVGYLPRLKGFYQMQRASADMYFFATE